MAAGAAATVSQYLTSSSWQRRQPRMCSLGRSAAPPAWLRCSGPPCRLASPAAPQRSRSAGRSWDPTASQNGSRWGAPCAFAMVPQPSNRMPQRPGNPPQARAGSLAAPQALPRRHAQVSFLELISNTLGDFTIIVLIISGVASVALELAFGKAGDNGWIEGAAILAAVAVVALVTAVNDYEKEQQFRELSALSSETQVKCGSAASESTAAMPGHPSAAYQHAWTAMPCIVQQSVPAGVPQALQGDASAACMRRQAMHPATVCAGLSCAWSRGAVSSEPACS